MEIWNRIGKLARGTADWVGDVGLAVVSPAKFVWDIATAPFNDREEFNGFTNTLRQAGIDLSKNVGRPIGGIIAAADKTAQNILREPLSAAFLVAGQQDFSKSGLQRAWNARNEISIGQSAASALLAPAKLLPDQITPEFLDEDFNIYDEKKRKEAFSKSVFGRAISGSLDTVAQFAFDPTLIVGKTVKAIRSVDDAWEAIQKIRVARAGDEVNEYVKLAEDFANNDAVWAAAHPWVRATNNETDVAYLLGQTRTKEEALDTMLAILGDDSGIKRLEELRRPDLAEPIRIANGELDRSSLKILLREEERMLGGQQEDMLQFIMRTPEEIAQDRAYIQAWAQHDRYFGQLQQVAAEAPATRGIGLGEAATGKFKATARTVPYYNRDVGDATVTMYQPTPYHKLYSIVQWTQRERPSGLVNLNDGESIREITATVERLRFKRLMSDNEAAQFITRYAAAVSPEARGLVVNELERTGYRRVAAKNGVDLNTAEELFNFHISARSGKMREIREEGFLWDAIENRMIRVPLLESQTANFLPIANFDEIDRVLGANSSVIKALAGRTIDIQESVSDLWKASVLLRLGYPVRNAVDSQLRIWATVGAMASLRHLGPGSRNLMNNVSDFATKSRLVDRFKMVKRPDVNQVRIGLQSLGREITELQNGLKKLDGKLALEPENADITGRIVALTQELKTKLAVYDGQNKYLSELEKVAIPSKKLKEGEGALDIASSISGADGLVYTVNDAFGSPNGELFRELSSSDTTFRSLLQDYSALYGPRIMSKSRGAVRPEDPQYYQSWTKAINEDFMNSAVARKLIAGERVEDVGRWLEGEAGLRSRLNLAKTDSTEYVSTVKGFVDNYIPEGYGIRQELMGSYSTLKNKWPGLQEYRDGGSGGIVGTRSVVGFVRTSSLKNMSGNVAGNKEAIDFYRKSLREGKGFSKDFRGETYNEPIMVVYDNETGLAYIGEGNHRLQAALAEGVEYVPVRVVKGNKSEMVTDAEVGKFPKQIKNNKQPQFPETRGPNAGKVRDENYVPPEMHPKYVFDEGLVVTADTGTSKVNEQFLRNAVKDPEKLPVVHGHLLDENLNLRSVGISKKIINQSFKWLATMPEDALARHPLFIDLYRKSIASRIATLEQLKGKSIPREEFEAIQFALEKSARADALKGIKSTLYNVERRTNAAYVMRFIMPFFSAQENAVKTWLRIAADKPQIVYRAQVIWNAPNRGGLVVDENGEPVPPNKEYNANDTMWLQVPKIFKKLPLIGEGLSSLDQIGISKRSLDVAFQGNPFGVNLGPLRAIPVANVMKLKPELSEVLGFAFPFGPDASIKQFAPTWLRRQWEKLEGQENSDYAKMFQLIWLTEQQKAREEMRPYLSEGEIVKKVNAYYNMRTAASLLLPFSPQFDSPYRFYMDKWRQYSEKYGLGADAKFLDDFPEYFSFATTLSKNPTGSTATMDDVQNAKRYKGLIAELNQYDSTLIGLVTRGSNAAKYNPTAYWWQSETSISPGTPEKFRGKQTPIEAAQKNQAREGWAKYRKATALLDLELEKRGLTSYEQSAASDLKAMRQAVIDALSTEIDPVTREQTNVPSAWYQDYKDIDGLKTAKVVIGLKRIVADEQFMEDNADDPTWKSVSLYLKIREEFAKKLRGRQVSSIDAKSNADLKLMLDFYVNQLKRGDVQFADIYERYLSRDMIFDRYLDSGM